MTNDYKDLARRLRGFENIFAVAGPAADAIEALVEFGRTVAVG